jgi:hypothetical protein
MEEEDSMAVEGCPADSNERHAAIAFETHQSKVWWITQAGVKAQENLGRATVDDLRLP